MLHRCCRLQGSRGPGEAVEAGVTAGGPADVAHVLLALCQGLTTQEAAGWLGRSRASTGRRWDLAVRVLLTGLAPGSLARGS